MIKQILILMAVFTASTFSQGLERENVQKIVASDPGEFDVFSSSVAIDGNYAVIGAYNEDEGGDNAGAAYFFERNNSGSWVEVAKVTASDAEAEDKFGYSVSIDGNYAVVGARDEDGGGTDAGAAYFFERNNSGSWVEVANVNASDAEAGDNFGYSVGISGTYSVISAYLEDEGGADAGAAYFFERNNSGSWVQVAKVTASYAEAGDEFGYSVGISGTYSVISAYLEDEGGFDAGAAYFFERNNSGSWVEVAKVIASDAEVLDFFGYSVSIDGNYTVVGARDEDDGGTDAGAAYFYERNNSGSWVQVAKVTASDAEGGDEFGGSVGISGPYSVIGATSEDDIENQSGAAYFFERNNSGSWVEVQKVKASDAGNTDQFGYSVGISGSYSVIGAFLDDDGGTNAGAVYIYEGVSEVAPELYSLAAEATDATSATFYADVADGGVTTTFTFDYGTATNDYSFSYSNTLAGNSATVNVGFEDDSNLAANTQYFVRASATNSVTWTVSEEISFWTLTDEPATQPEFGQVGEANTTISLTFSSLDNISADGYVLIRSSLAIGENDLPSDATTYVDDNTIGDATVIEVITDGSATSTTLTNLSTERSWQFALIPFNEGTDPSTINYLTVNPATIQGYTIPTLGEWGMIAFSSLMLIGGVWYTRKRA